MAHQFTAGKTHKIPNKHSYFYRKSSPVYLFLGHKSTPPLDEGAARVRKILFLRTWA